VRKILLLLILMAVAASASADVTLGEIEVRSFLNQPLQAQIRAEGRALAGEDVEFRVASEDAFRRAGLERSAVPADLRIEVEGTGTSRVVRVTTLRPVREPYLGLLLEARWTAGRVLREFNILLDPPVAFARERSAAPVVTRSPDPVAREAPAPVLRAERPAPAGIYTVRRGDTLTAIVRRQGYAGVTDQQVMLAIRDANPQAFINGNINQLRAGAELRLPEQTEVAVYGRQEALQEVRRQVAEWRERTAPTPPPAFAAAAPVTGPVPEVPPQAAEPPSSESLPEVEPEPAADVAETAEPAAPPEAAEDEAAAPVAEAEPAADLAELAVMDRLEILGEDEFEPMTVASAGTQAIEEALLSQQVAMRELRDELNMLRSELAERDQLINVMSAEFAQLEERSQFLREQRSDDALRGSDAAALHQRLLADPLLLLLAAISLLLFLLLLVSLFRPRVSPAAAGVPTVHRAPAEPASVTPPVRGRTSSQKTGGVHQGTTGAVAAGAGAAAGTAVLASEAVASQAVASEGGDKRTPVSLGSPSLHIDVSDDPKVEDILADVDLYLAYGMNDQAITALENAIRDGRDDPEYRVRLIEAYAASGDGDAVRREAGALRERLGPDQEALRERVAAAEAQAPAPDSAGDRTGGQEDGDDAARPSAADNAMEFDLSGAMGGAPDAHEGSAGSNRSEPDFNHGALRFDLDDAEEGSAAERGRASDDGEADELPELSLPDLEPVEPEGPQGMGSGSDSDTSENGMKLSLAEAFVEMGDREGAMSLLDEILPTATDGQKAKVEALRRQIEGSDG
jgi:pilus assembly protein FimV